MKTEMYNNNGELSAYGLACGYAEIKENKRGKKQMYIEHNHIHIRHHDLTEVSIVEVLHEVFESNELTKARKLYKSIKL